MRTRFWLEFRRNYITEADIKRIAELGFNSVRPALNARRFLTEGDNPVDVDEGFELLDNLVGWCKKYNVYVIIDMHGAPGGQTGANIDDSANDQPELFLDPKYQDRLIDLWVKIAERYKNEPTVAGYDLLNEPLPERTGAAAKHTRQQLEPLYRRHHHGHSRSRQEAHDHPGRGRLVQRLVGLLRAVRRQPCSTSSISTAGTGRTSLKDISTFLDYRKKLNAPVWVGETGEKNNAIYWATMQYFEANNIGWSFWPWKKMDTANTPYSIEKPAGWDEIAAFSRGQAKPSKETAHKAFDELLQNVRIENCVYSAGVVNALFRRLPVKIEAENFGHDGLGKSYSVNDPSQKSPNYRKSEPVPIEVSEGGEGGGNRRRESHQSIRLAANEWSSYRVNSQDARPCSVVIRARPTTLPAAFTFTFNDQTEEIALSDSTWTEVKCKAVKAVADANRMELRVKSGTILFDWVDVE